MNLRMGKKQAVAHRGFSVDYSRLTILTFYVMLKSFTEIKRGMFWRLLVGTLVWVVAQPLIMESLGVACKGEAPIVRRVQLVRVVQASLGGPRAVFDCVMELGTGLPLAMRVLTELTHRVSECINSAHSRSN